MIVNLYFQIRFKHKKDIKAYKIKDKENLLENRKLLIKEGKIYNNI